VKIKSKIDIRNAGSGNVGARNAYEVTGSKGMGWMVFVIDFFKGVLIILSIKIFGGDPWTAISGGAGAVLGHIFNPWLGFKGGRGLATTAGIMVLMGWMYVIVWCLIYLMINAYLKQVNLSSVIASISSPVIMLVLPAQVVTSLCYPYGDSGIVIINCAILSILILIGHRGPIKDYLTKEKE
jgi:glycerol-3-phosphate acyltransferase PlsY